MTVKADMPGTSGNFFDTADTNLLDADSAHIYQGVGDWTSGGNSTRTQETDAAASKFGGKVHQLVVVTAATDSYVQNPSGTSGFPVSASTEYTISLYGYTTVADRTLHTRIYYYDSGGASISNEWASSPTALVVGTRTQHKQTFTTPASTAYIRVKVMFRDASGGVTNLASGDTLKLSAHSLRTGSDGTFVPSIRIVGDLDLRFKHVNADWTNTSRGAAAIAPSATTSAISWVAWSTGNVASRPRFRFTTDGVTLEDANFAAVTRTDALGHHHQITRDASSGDVNLYLDGVLQQTINKATGAIQYPGAAFGIGYAFGPNSHNTDSDIEWTELRDGIDGPVVRRWDAEDWVGV